MFDVTGFNLEQFLYPIWQGDISYAEAAFVRESPEGGIAPIALLYPIDEIISVRSADLGAVYTEGTDYFVENGMLCVPENSRIPRLAYADYYFPLTDEEHEENRLATKFPAAGNRGWGYIRAEIGPGKPGMSAWMLAVTYRHSADSIVTPPAVKSDVFASLTAKLESGRDIKIVATGDSITDGWSASGKNGVNIPPYCPQYNVLVQNFMESRYGVKVTQKNVGVSGSNTNGGLTKLDEICAEQPDLVIIAFGMNDGCGISPETYTANINTMVGTIAERCPEACTVVVGTCLPNDLVALGPGGGSLLRYHIEYADCLKNAEKTWKNAAHADVTTVNIEMFRRKVYQDVAGSNSNHPNDYMHRVYAQVVLRTIFGEWAAE
ncbi:MAG: SGNH/GDSL hydrolase family protein [Clostridia bacterium]|nr:SGNH/GDSL hydrolase family protein [Clostridia bacterium]